MLPLNKFTPQAEGRLGVSSSCKQCRNARYRATRAANPPPRKPKACHEHECQFCHSVYTSSHKRSNYCSRTCSQKFRYANNPQAVRDRVRAWEQRNLEAHRLNQQTRTIRRRKKIEGTVYVRDWRRTLRRFNHACAYCGRKNIQLTVEHVVPISRGGMNTIGNVVPACSNCNNTKNNLTVMEWRMRDRRNEEARKRYAC